MSSTCLYCVQFDLTSISWSPCQISWWFAQPSCRVMFSSMSVYRVMNPTNWNSVIYLCCCVHNFTISHVPLVGLICFDIWVLKDCVRFMKYFFISKFVLM